MSKAKEDIDRAFELFLERLNSGLVTDERAAIIHLAEALKDFTPLLLGNGEGWDSVVSTNFVTALIKANGGPLRIDSSE